MSNSGMLMFIKELNKYNNSAPQKVDRQSPHGRKVDSPRVTCQAQYYNPHFIGNFPKTKAVEKKDNTRNKDNSQEAIARVLEMVSSLNQKLEDLRMEVRGIKANVKDLKTEMVKEIKAEIGEELKAIKTELSTDMGRLNKRGEMNETALSTLFRKISISADGKQHERETRMEKGIEDFNAKMEDLMTEVHSLREEALKKEQFRERKQRMTQLGNYLKLKMENKMSEKHLELTEEQLEPVEVQAMQTPLSPPVGLLMVHPPASHPLMTSFTLWEHNGLFRPFQTCTLGGIGQKMLGPTYEGLFSDGSSPKPSHPFKSQVRVALKTDDFIYMSLPSKEPEDGQQMDDGQVLPKVYYLLKDRSGSTRAEHYCRPRAYYFGSKLKYPDTYLQQVVHKNWFRDPVFNVDDSVEMEVYVEPAVDAEAVHSFDGTLSWLIQDCRKKKGVEKERLVKFQESPYFYTSPEGYRVQVKLALNGLEEHRDKGPSLFIEFLQGRNDRKLVKSFPHCTFITMHNPVSGHYCCKSVEGDINEKRWYRVDLGLSDEIEHLIENDTLYIRVDIRPIIEEKNYEVYEAYKTLADEQYKSMS